MLLYFVIIPLAVFLVVLIGAYSVALVQAKLAFILVILFASAILAMVCPLISKLVIKKRRNKPSYSIKQKEQLRQAAQEDERIKAKNDSDEAAAKAEYEKNLPSVIDNTKLELQKKTEELHACALQLKEHLQTFSSMDQLSDNDKCLQTISCLIYFIETHRADSIKEALHEYDKAVSANQLAELEKQRIQLQQQQLQMQRKQMQMQQQHQSNVEAALVQAAISAERDRARQRDMMYVHCMNIESTLGSIASHSRQLAETADVYCSKYY